MRNALISAAIILIFLGFFTGGHTANPAPLDTPSPELTQALDDFVANHPGGAMNAPWTQPSAVYTVAPDPHYRAGVPCDDKEQCTTRPGAPSQITIFTHTDDEYERTHPNYGHDYCMQLMREMAPGTTCTVRPDPDIGG